MGSCSCTENIEKHSVNPNNINNLYDHLDTERLSLISSQSPKARIQALVHGYLSRKKFRLTLLTDSLQSIYRSLPQFSLGNVSNFSCFFEDGVYEGEVNVFNQPHGKGKFINRECVKEGCWVNGSLSGYCRVVSEAEVFVGEFKENLREGYGELNGKTIYKGKYSKNKRHGQGTETWPNGSIFEGNYNENVRTGQGLLIWQNGSRYKGDFKNNKITGNGEFLSNNGNRYKGEWLNNQMEGRGTFDWADGKKYEGGYKKNKKSGFGVLITKDLRYEGLWKKGKQHGKGVLITKDTKKEGIWHSGKFCGYL